MASTSEIGYAKQLAGFEDFIKSLQALGTDYKPPKAELEVASLLTQFNSGKTAMRAISTAIPAYSMAVDKQAQAFLPLNDKINRSLRYLKVCINNPAEIDTAKNLADKIRGVQKSKKVTATAALQGEKTISQAQLSYDSRIENFKQYIDVLAASGVYKEPGSGIEIGDLRTMLEELESTNLKVAETKMPLDVARKQRDLIFYAPTSGIADLVFNAKTYLKAVLPKTNPFYKGLSAFSFKKRVRK